LPLNFLAHAGSGVVNAEGINQAIGGSVVDHATLDAGEIVIVRVHEMHARHEQRLVGECAVALAPPVVVVGHALQGLEEALEGQTRRGKLRLEMSAKLLPGIDLSEHLKSCSLGLPGEPVDIAQHGRHIEEARDGDGLLRVGVNVEVGPHGAVGVRREIRAFVILQVRQQFREGRYAGQREPIFILVGQAGLVGDGVRQIRLREALALEFSAVDAPRETNRLEAEATDAVDVVDGQANHVADLVVVHAFHDGGNEDDLQACLPAVFDASQLFLQQPLAARAKVNFIADPVELQVKRVEAGFLAFPGELQVGEFNAVGRALDVGEAHLGGHAQDVVETRINGGLAA